jgi:hypothetical protein
MGRWFTEAEGETGAAPVAVLSHGLWVRRFGRDPGIVGRSVPLNGVPTEVIGVMPASFRFPDDRTELWTAAQSTRANASFLFSLNGIARLRDDTTIDTARAEITTLIQDLSRRVPNQTGMASAAVPLQDLIVGRIATALWVLLASAASRATSSLKAGSWLSSAAHWDWRSRGVPCSCSSPSVRPVFHV